MAIINVALSDTFDTWRQKTNTLGTNIGDLALLDTDFAATDLVGALNEIRAGEEFTQIDLPDSTGASVGRVKLGDDDDLQIYHDGTHSRIADVGTGDLKIGTSGGAVRITANGVADDMIVANQGGTVTLAHSGTTKLTTSATGITVSGDIATSDNTSGKIMVANGTNFDSVAVSGDATLASSGALTIATGAVGASEIADGSITSTEFNSTVTLVIYNSAGTAVKTLRTPGS